jgi:hypothetical protein
MPFIGSCIIHILNTGCAKIWDLTRYAKGWNSSVKGYICCETGLSHNTDEY